MIRRLYGKLIERNLKILPNHIMIVANEDLINNFNKFVEFIEWCRKFEIGEITLCFSDDKIENIERFEKIEDFKIRIVKKEGVFEKNDGKLLLNIILGYKGRDEIVDVVKILAKLVEGGKLNPEDVNEGLIERYLVIKTPPDLIIKTGEEIPEFLTWQSIYSELYFADLDWKSFRYIDFLRCLREYQRRERRYGR
ncbi:di-trans,poly-cis-decaprenylcistransferase [Archaeoglobales archaeon]|nr:MAG: di-trans,poly-cis-decaprenylcistransferase [Archaeoglobales archaeon]